MKRNLIKRIWDNGIVLYLLVAAIVFLVPFFCLRSIEVIKETYNSNIDYTIREYTKQTATVISRELDRLFEELDRQEKEIRKISSSDFKSLEDIMIMMRTEESRLLLYVDGKIYPSKNSEDDYFGFSKYFYYSDSGIIEPYKDKKDKACFGLYCIVEFDDGEEGYLYREIPIDYLKNFYVEYAHDVIASSYIINNAGEILCRSDNAYSDPEENSLFQLIRDENGKGTRWEMTGLANDIMDKKLSTAKFKLGQKSSILCFAPIQGTNWSLVLCIPESIVNAQMNRAVSNIFALIIVIFALVAVLSTIIIKRSLKRQRAKDEKYSSEKKMMVSAVSETHSAVVAIRLENGIASTLFDDGKLGIDLSRFTYYDDLEKMILSITPSQYSESVAESFSLKTLNRILNETNRNIYSEVEFTIKGERHWVAIDVTLVDPKEKCALYMIRFIDNEKLEDIRKREVLTAALDSAEKANEAKTVFLNSMSHDVRTPMNGIIGMTEIAKVNVGNDDKVRECLDKISLSSKKLLALINDILEVSKIESGEEKINSSDFDLVDFFKAVLDITTSDAQEKKHTVNVNADDIIHRAVTGDESKLMQIFRNIINNAIKYTDEGGNIDLTLKETGLVGDDCAEYEFICSDNGIGIRHEFLKKVFVPFERSDEARTIDNQGAGLGLVISKNLARMMAGDIKVESTYKRGSKFTVKFRLIYRNASDNTADGQSEDGRNQLDAFSDKDYSDKRVLLVEDNELNREIAVEILEMTGIKVECAEDGSEAVDMFEDNEPFYYDLILMDINMPIMDGHEATRVIRGLKKEDSISIPIVAMSANAFLEDMTSSINAGMNEHIGKPISLPKLLKVMENYL